MPASGGNSPAVPPLDLALGSTVPASRDIPLPAVGDPAVEAMRRRLSERLFGEVQEPVYLGRFRILATLGAGGMGVIFAAHDDKLGRTVALKVIRASVVPRGDEQERLLEEARALARLSHPNVIPVYEVGEAEGDVVVVMEHVSGMTLQRWLAEERRTSSQILAHFIAAGRGLAAAHAANVVHGDFKPSNVLIGHDGRVRLIDFGLAHGVALGRPPGGGTPAYMPPEASLGQPVDARGDQFSFCVSLFEALWGRLPFEPGASVGANFVRRVDLTPPTGRKVPAWLRRLVVRGLAFAPAERHASMSALLDALERTPRRRRLATLGVAAAVSVAASMAATVHVTRRTDPCAHASDPLEGVWNAHRRDLVRAAFLATDVPFADRAWGRVRDAIDAYSARWTAVRRESCEATWVRGEQSELLLDRSMYCLDQRRVALVTSLELLEHADPGRIAAAEEMLAALPAPDACRDRELLLADARAAETDPRVEAVRAAVQQAELLYRARQGHEALASLEAAIVDSIALKRQDLEAHALLVRGMILAIEIGDDQAAAEAFHRAYELATASGHDDIVWVIWAQLARLSANTAAGVPQARTFLKYARSAHRRLPGADPLAEATLANIEADLAESVGDLDAALTMRRTALEIRQRFLQPGHPDLMTSRLLVARAVAARGEQRAALGLLREVLAEQIHLRGADHPATLTVEHELADVHLEIGEYEAARRLLEHERPLLAERLGEDSPTIGSIDLRLADVAMNSGQPEVAVAAARSALAVFARHHPPHHPDRVRALMILASLLAERRSYAEALVVFMELLAVHDAHPELGIEASQLLVGIGDMLCVLDRCSEALPYFSRLLSEFARNPPEERGVQAFPLQGLGRVHLARGEPELALPFLEEAFEMLRRYPETSAELTASTARLLARALVELGVQRRRASRLVRQAEAIESARRAGAG